MDGCESKTDQPSPDIALVEPKGVAALDAPPTLRAVAHLDVEAAHHGAHRRKVS